MKKKDRSSSPAFCKVSKFSNVIMHLIFIVFCISCIYPVLLIIGTSFTDEDAIAKYGYSVIPKVFSTSSYEYILTSAKSILNAYGVTIFVTITGTIGSVAMIALFAYPLSRKELKYRKFFTTFLFITMLFGGGLVPWYMVCTRILNFRNQIYALIIPGLFNAYNVIIMRTFFQTTIPDEVIEAARIDGASDIKTFLRIVIPLSKPGLATIGLFSCIGYWNDWYNPMLFITKESLVNLSFYIQRIMGSLQYLTSNATQFSGLGDQISRLPAEGARMAVVIITIGPIILVYPFFQRYFVKGLTIGAVKG